jgi:hypothetical protein
MASCAPFLCQTLFHTSQRGSLILALFWPGVAFNEKNKQRKFADSEYFPTFGAIVASIAL